MQYRRVYVEGGCYFFTLALAGRKSDLLQVGHTLHGYFSGSVWFITATCF